QPAKGAQRDEHLLAVDAPADVAAVQPGGAVERGDQGDDAGDLPPLAEPPQDRGPPVRAQAVPTRARNGCPVSSRKHTARPVRRAPTLSGASPAAARPPPARRRAPARAGSAAGVWGAKPDATRWSAPAAGRGEACAGATECHASLDVMWERLRGRR